MTFRLASPQYTGTAFLSGPALRAPERLTDLERHYDEIQRFENRDRYVAQSAATGVNDRAPLPSRPALAGAHR